MKLILERLFITTVFLCSCSIFKASPLPDTGFLPHGTELKSLAERSPFHGVWYADKNRLDEMKKVYQGMYVLPVDTTYLESQIQNEKRSPEWKAERIEDVREMARYMETRLKASINEYPNHPLKVVESPGAKVFVFEASIVELNPTNTAVTTLSTAAGFFIPGTGLLARAGSGSIALEAILRDGETGDSLVELRDRTKDKTAPISIKDYQMYAHAREAIDDWSEILAELSATTYSHKVTGPSGLTLNPF